MTAVKEDRRIRRTKKAVRGALLRLMKNKTVSQISATELCSEADINRSTFYVHYSAPEDVLKSIEEEFLNELEALLDNALENGRIIVELLNIIDAAREQWYSIWHGDPRLIERAMDLAAQKTLELWHAEGYKSEQEVMLFMRYATRGAAGIIGEWLDGGCRTSPEELGELIKRFVYLGQKGLNIEEPQHA